MSAKVRHETDRLVRLRSREILLTPQPSHLETIAVIQLRSASANAGSHIVPRLIICKRSCSGFARVAFPDSDIGCAIASGETQSALVQEKTSARIRIVEQTISNLPASTDTYFRKENKYYCQAVAASDSVRQEVVEGTVSRRLPRSFGSPLTTIISTGSSSGSERGQETGTDGHSKLTFGTTWGAIRRGSGARAIIRPPGFCTTETM